MNIKYLALETRRVIRAPRFLIFTVGFPVVFYLLFSNLYGNQGGAAEQAATRAWIMAGMAAFGALTAAVSTGTRIATERGAGWQRQLRLTPLSGGAYLVTKALVGMLVSVGPLLLVCAVGAATGVRLDAAAWAQLVIGTWLGLLPFAVLGVLIGQLSTPDSVQPIGSATFMLLSIGGGLWFPPELMPTWLNRLAHVLPSFWYGGIGRDAVGHQGVTMQTVLVLGVWTVGLALVAARRYRADTARV
ncbi:ABC transporter permease [Gandjariella thermophila]|uniref:ABC transporter n=1 Tax=Gandjariella thermophila TaxID=1931992 RepID=A0A4D4JC04_9PSEU|nr:ABC transporter permease [Gandjariella thermophila]GDY31393.1 ABC transporter [Gandjariella thermophila]